MNDTPTQTLAERKAAQRAARVARGLKRRQTADTKTKISTSLRVHFARPRIVLHPDLIDNLFDALPEAAQVGVGRTVFRSLVNRILLDPPATASTIKS